MTDPQPDPANSMSPQASVEAKLRQRGYPLDKAHYLWMVTAPLLPEFPLDPEIEGMVPDELPGTLPETMAAFLRATAPRR
jgi:hypothetical protein